MLSAGVNFLVNRRFVFGAGRRRPVGGAAVRYGTLVVALLALNYAVMAAVTELGLALLPAKVLTEAGLVVVSYLAQRHLVFARPRPGGEVASSVTQEISATVAARLEPSTPGVAP